MIPASCPPLPNRPLVCIHPPCLLTLALYQLHQSALLKKTSHDFQLSLAAFQNAQKLSAERQRTVVQVVKQTATAGDHDGAAASGSSEPAGAPGSPRLQQTQLQIKYVFSAQCMGEGVNWMLIR